MDIRFQHAWEELAARREAGERMPDLLLKARTRDLIGALAGSAAQDPVAANAIATELLNRQLRAPFLGAFLVGVGLIVATFVVDEILTDAPLFALSESSTRGYVVTAIAAVVACFSLVMLLAWRRRSGGILHGLLIRHEARKRGGGRTW